MVKKFKLWWWYSNPLSTLKKHFQLLIHNDDTKEIIRKYKKLSVREGGLKKHLCHKWNLLAQFKGRPNATNTADFMKKIKKQ
jgi:hypothetical protein